MNNKGFTMVELLVSMAILALLTVMAFPTLRSIETANSNKKMEAYGESLVSAAKLYTDSYESDMFNDGNTDVQIVNFEDLYNKKLVKDINLKGSTCKQSQIVVAKNEDNYIYCLNLRCDNDGREVSLDDENIECNKYKSYAITYHSNYSENSVNLKEKVFKEYILNGNDYTLRGEIKGFKPGGFRFAGWSKNKNVNSNFSLYPSSFKVEKKDYNIYAKWCHECNSISNGTCTLKNPLTNNNECNYDLKCNPGYTLNKNNGFDATCRENSYTIKYVNVSNKDVSETKKFTEVYTLTSKKTITVKYDMGDTGIKKFSDESKDYTFNGWTAKSTEIDSSTAMNGTSKWNGSSTKNNSFSRLSSKNGATVNLTGSWKGPTFTLPTISKTGHTCVWTSSGLSDIKSGGSYTPSSAISRTFKAVCTPNTYTCSAGTYLKANATSCSNCESGYYCAGGNYKYNNSIQGRNACPSGYDKSPDKSTKKEQCYIDVSAGYYLSKANGTTTTQCGSGTYKEAHSVTYGNTSKCKDCPTGYRDGNGTTKEENCIMSVENNKYVKNAKDSSSTSCSSGYISNSHTVKYGNTSSCTYALPSVPTVKLCIWGSSKPSSCNGLNSYSSGTWLSGYVLTVPSSSKATYYQYTTTGATTNNTNMTDTYRNVEAEGVSYIKWRACNNIGCSSYSSAYTIKLDRTRPTIDEPKCKINRTVRGNVETVMAGDVSDSLSGIKYWKSDYTNSSGGHAPFISTNFNVKSADYWAEWEYNKNGAYADIVLHDICDYAGNCTGYFHRRCTNSYGSMNITK